jgi:hypothetical protein
MVPVTAFSPMSALLLPAALPVLPTLKCLAAVAS